MTMEVPHLELRRRVNGMFDRLVTKQVDPNQLSGENPAIVLAAIALNLFPGLRQHMDLGQLQAIVDAFDSDAKEPKQDTL